ncbi:histidine kinase [Candidatus Entotheonella serta]|nr:histidine kinase [Candidatus Entotheonella serta]
MESAIQEFLVESSEALDQLDQDLVDLEQHPDDQDLLSSVFRIIHTIKGSSGCFGFLNLESVTHVGENLLSLLRDGELQLRSEMISGLLALADAVRAMLGTIQTSGDDGNTDHSDLIETLTHLQTGPAPASSESTEMDETEESNETLPNSPIPSVVASQNDDLQQEARAAGVNDNSIRVDVALLDKLMNQVGELVLTRNQIMRLNTTQEDAGFAAVCHRLNLITADLQEGIMKTRMQPIGTIWNRFPRMVRDLAIACGKQVRLEMEGQDTELDKSLIVEHVVQKALQRQLITSEQAANMHERELLNLLFLPGFSTAEQVTNISGRGVDLDVIKANITKLGGTIDIQSTPGLGTTLIIKLPLTLAIIPALVISSAGDRYAIPQENLQELVRLEASQVRSRVEMIHGTPVYRLRGQLLPLVYLTRALQVEDAAAANDEERSINIVVLQVDNRQFGLVVDTINDVEEIVVKPLAKQLKDISVFAGAAIMGDGRVSLVLDLPGLAQHTNVVAEEEESVHLETMEPVHEEATDRQTLLLFRTADDGRMAVPLSMVARLEEVPRAAIETAGNQEVIQYRDQILPLIDLAKILPDRRLSPRYAEETEAENVHLVVFSDQGRSVGLMVEHILDIVEESLDVQGRTSREGVQGTVVIQGRVTELLDVNWAIQMGDPSFFEPIVAAAVEA